MTFQRKLDGPRTDVSPRRIGPAALATRVMTASQAKLQNQFAARDMNLRVQDPLLGTLIVEKADSKNAPPPAAETIMLDCNGVPFNLSLTRPMLGGLLDNAGFGPEFPALQQDTNLAALVAEHLLSALLGDVEQQTGLNVTLCDIVFGPTDARATATRQAYQVTCDLWQDPVQAELWSDDPAAGTVFEKLTAQLPVQMGLSLASRAARGTPVLVSVRAASQTLSMNDLAALRIGDGVLCGRDFSAQTGLTLVIANSLAGPCVADATGGRLTMAGPLSPLNETMEITMKPHDGDIAGIGDLPVTLTLELDRMEIAFNELADMHKGSVVTFSNSDSLVRLAANGRPFATGHLVALQEDDGTVRHAIQIETFAATHDADINDTPQQSNAEPEASFAE
ncbi:FliM/FliN family flagellar motor switch protein [Yoonia maritima]|uniref:FliM/FliN family flagellar motor switch protein n=1 Tax=Yoonia maritima TaxID=1435347 RepID=UPI000D0EF413|nr:FliM/FliN family flagellar motor switch protein [Yoonia maritima]